MITPDAPAPSRALLVAVLSIMTAPLITACSFDTDLAGLTFECSETVPCGEGMTCDLEVGICVDDAVAALPPICVESACTTEDALRCQPPSAGVAVQRCVRDQSLGCLIWVTEEECSDGLSCTVESCDPGALCQEGDGAGCAPADACTVSVREGDCFIDGVCQSAGSLDVVGCRSCQPEVRNDAWSHVPNDAECEDGNLCTEGDACQVGFCIPGDPKTCSDGLICTNDTCDPDSGECASAPLSAYCLIEGTCYTAATPSPDNPCMGCNPGESAEAFTANVKGALCDDANPCTTSDACDSGVCVGALPLDCNDHLDCTLDSCDPSTELGCVHLINAGTCVIEGQCWAEGIPVSGDGCLTCDTAENPQSWTLVDDGDSCDSGDYCTVAETCATGVCQGGQPRGCSDGLDCTADTCSSDIEACAHSLEKGHCLIDSACKTTGDVDAPGGCKICDPAFATDAWVHAPSGQACSDGNPCSLGDTCSESVCQAGEAKDCSDGLDCTGDTCDALTGACASTLDGGHCEIDGQCVPTGTPAPTNSCLACLPGASETAYTLRPEGSQCDDADVCTLSDACDGSGFCAGGQALVCDDGIPCTTDTCVSEDEVGCVPTLDAGQCLIDSDDGAACYASGETSTLGGCLSCAPALATGAWTEGSCDDGLSCTEDLCASDTGLCESGLSPVSCLIDGACVAEDEVRPDNPCEVCAPSFKDSGWTPQWGTVCHPYPGGEALCEAGVCQFACPEPLSDCDAQPDNGCETDTSQDLLHCGECGNLCTGGFACKDGTCTADCGDELEKCGPYCADLDTSIEHCGDCDSPCAYPDAEAICQASACAMGVCADGFVDINGETDDGCECALSGDEVCDGLDNDCDGQVDNVADELLAGDPMNCAVCGEICPASNATQQAVCAGGVCSEAFCAPDTWNLDGLSDNGCEYGCVYADGEETCDGADDNCNGLVDEDFDLLVDVTNCGACGEICAASAVPDGSPDAVSLWSCVNGSCFIQKCESGWQDKDLDPSNGCEHAFAPDGVFYVHWLDGNDFTADGSDDYPFQTIQGALNAVPDEGWTVHVGEGSYAGDVLIPASLEGLRLQGAGSDVTTLQSLEFQTGLTIQANDVTVTDLRITGGRVGISAVGTAEVPIVGLSIERVHTEGQENLWLSCSKCGYPEYSCGYSQPEESWTWFCSDAPTIGVNLVHTEDAFVTLMVWGATTGGDGMTNYWYPRRGQAAVGLRIAHSSGCVVQANQAVGPITGGLGSAGNKIRIYESGHSVGIQLEEVTDCEVSGNLIGGLAGKEGRAGAGFPWGYCTAGQGGRAVGIRVSGGGGGVNLSDNTVQSAIGGAGGAGGTAGGYAIGVELEGGASGVTLAGNSFLELVGGSHGTDGRAQAAYGVYLHEDSLDHDIAASNHVDELPIYYLYGADGVVLADLDLTAPGNPTNLGKLAIVASTNVTVSGGEIAGFRAGEGLISTPNGQATGGGDGAGILLWDCAGCTVSGVDIHHIEGGRGGTSYNTRGPGTSGWAAGVVLKGEGTTGGTLTGNTLHDLTGGPSPPCPGDSCPYLPHPAQGAVGVFLYNDTLDNAVDETNLIDGEPIVYRYGAFDELLEGFVLQGATPGTNIGQIVVLESQGVTIRDCEVSDLVALQGVETGNTAAGVVLIGCTDCTVDGLVVHDLTGGSGSSVGGCGGGYNGGAAVGLYLENTNGFSVSHALFYGLVGGPSGDANCGAGKGGIAIGIETSGAWGSIDHATITGLTGGAGSSTWGSTGLKLNAQSEGQVLQVRHTILSGAQTTCVDNLDTNPAGAVQLFDSGLHACGPDGETWAQNAALVTGMMYVDPLFEAPSLDNYHLKSASPLIDAGLSGEGQCEAYALEPEPNGCAANIGYYGDSDEAATKAGASHCVCPVAE